MILTKREIEEIAHQELKKYFLNTKLIFLKKSQFQQKELNSPIILRAIKEGDLLEEFPIPALVSPKKDTIYLHEEFIKKLLKDEPLSIQSRLIRAIILHEIFHLKEKKGVNSINSAERSEEESSRNFEKAYPGLAALGKRLCKKYISGNS